jgi:hypothetical protein
VAGRPEGPPTGILDALTSGKVHLDDRLRVEWAETTGRLSSTAVTNRLRLGYEAGPPHGLSVLVEMANVAAPDEDTYYVPATKGGDLDRTPIADPPRHGGEPGLRPHRERAPREIGK